MSDLIKQLHECANGCQDQRMVGDAYVMREAAAEITRLRAKVEAADKLHAAVRGYLNRGAKSSDLVLALMDYADAER